MMTSEKTGGGLAKLVSLCSRTRLLKSRFQISAGGGGFPNIGKIFPMFGKAAAKWFNVRKQSV
jgi:hypothetical protein